MGLNLNVVMWCESVDIKKESVQAGLGLGLFYRGSAEAGLKDGYFKAIEIPRLENIKITYYVPIQKGNTPVCERTRLSHVFTPMVENAMTSGLRPRNPRGLSPRPAAFDLF